jgi:hypothetical protein
MSGILDGDDLLSILSLTVCYTLPVLYIFPWSCFLSLALALALFCQSGDNLISGFFLFLSNTFLLGASATFPDQAVD